jgi:uncharacterized membrane protein
MSSTLHKNYRTASYFLIGNFLLDPIEFFFSGSSWTNSADLGFILVLLAITAFNAYAVSRGVNWVKYILLVFIILAIAGFILSIGNPLVSWITRALSLVQLVLLITATVLLFRIPPPVDEDALDSDI